MLPCVYSVTEHRKCQSKRNTLDDCLYLTAYIEKGKLHNVDYVSVV